MIKCSVISVSNIFTYLKTGLCFLWLLVKQCYSEAMEGTLSMTTRNEKLFSTKGFDPGWNLAWMKRREVRKNALKYPMTFTNISLNFYTNGIENSGSLTLPNLKHVIRRWHCQTAAKEHCTVMNIRLPCHLSTILISNTSNQINIVTYESDIF